MNHVAPEQNLKGALESALGIPFTEGNEIVPFVNGVRIFPTMLDAIARAQSRIELMTYIYWSGGVAIDFVEVLEQRARAGVDVRLLLDGVGSWPMPRKLLRRLTAAGVKARWFRPVPRLRLSLMTHRTHRKILVVDSEVAFTGGVGIAAEWEGDADGPKHWRETHFSCRGPCVRGLRAAFYENWMETEFDAMPALEADPPPPAVGDMAVQVVKSRGSFSFSDVAMLHETLVDAARTRLRIATPYFVPTPATVKSLIDARQRGVEVDILVPGPYVDSRVSDLAGSDAFDPLLQAGVRIWRYQPTLIHAKIITVDGVLSCIGSANFNQRSGSKDDEVALNVLSPRLCAALDQHFAADQGQSEPVTLWHWRRRGRVRRLAEITASLIRSHT